MARLIQNSPLQGLRGTLGKDLVFRQWGKETLVSMKPQHYKKSSPAQKETRGKFREATEYAKVQMRDPVRKESYTKIAKKLKLPNAYTAAITEFMRKPVIERVEVVKTKGDTVKIRVKAYKKGFEVSEVQVVVRKKNGEKKEFTASKEGLGFGCAGFLIVRT